MTRRMPPRVGRFMVGASENAPDLLYATGFLAPDPFLWLAVDGTSYMVVSALELGRARRQARQGVTVLSEAEARERFALAAGQRVTPEAVLTAASRTLRVRHWETPTWCGLGLARRLQDAGLGITPVQEFFPQRACKTPAEVRAVRAGLALAEAGLAHALALLRASRARRDRTLWLDGAPLTAERLRGEIAAAVARGGGVAAHTIAAPGRQGADPHQAGEGPVRAGEPIVLDIFPRVEATGYFGDLTRTVVKGRAAPEVARAFAAVHAAQRAACRVIRAGVRASVPHEAAVATLAQHGFTTDVSADPPRGFIHGLGHGLGLEIHEAPRLGGRAEGMLAAGHVVTVEPGWYDPAWGGVRIEDVVLVTGHGCRRLTRAPVFLELA